ncbi:HI0074 family nucleotidyltransferase substrate-binding subunit [Mediterraneibacter glycyrrhizinilyticus]|uniref:HI0074 family nucleotidyltransferase substrate-binding subunit n=1 Tax=Mediterraneibacter glycyrrhizinilyticus TaxID=342942 RepID=UPI0025A3F06A|nr:HI0074 family nucleotidyltransferase substrate-binding subunit [Mediterraneibacter glycyrrhizinilyticus]MDM8124878.1 HI0074 family nucleotidyltransferase substrate-binding subunit [Mediterraneibacter glycyrrhizinilyticus]
MKKFDNYVSNLEVLQKAENEDLDNEFIISGIIDKFFIQFELSWKVLKELLRYEGKSAAGSGSPREILKAAYELYDFIDEDIWLDMLKSRNDMTHIYDGEAAKRLVNSILYRYIPEYIKLRDNILTQYEEVLMQI